MKSIREIKEWMYDVFEVDEQEEREMGEEAVQKRREGLKQLAEHTGRNTIAYYTMADGMADESHVLGFVDVTDGMDPAKGLDLIIHTTGGMAEAAEAIMKHLRKVFHNDIRVIVPSRAAGVGTLMALSAKEILFGRAACLGPIDVRRRVGGEYASVFSLYQEMRAAKEKMAVNPASVAYWKERLVKYPAGIFDEVMDCIRHCEEIATAGLTEVMFSDGSVDANGIKKIVAVFNNTNLSRSRRFDFDRCKEIGLRARELDEDVSLHNLVMMAHVMYFLYLPENGVGSLIEGDNGRLFEDR